MEKNELTPEQIKARNAARNRTIKDSQYRARVTLTKAEGQKFKMILLANDCDNASQLCKKIVRGETIIY